MTTLWYQNMAAGEYAKPCPRCVDLGCSRGVFTAYGMVEHMLVVHRIRIAPEQAVAWLEGTGSLVNLPGKG